MNAQTLPVAVQPMQAAAAPQQYLTFTLGAEVYAVPIAPIREIIEFPGVTRIPLTPGCLSGVINLRGSVLPVIDLSVRFGQPAGSVTRRTCVVVVEIRLDEDVHALGVVVDAVNEVLEVGAAQFEVRPSFGLGLRNDFVAGMLNIDEQFIVVLDMDRVLSAAELEQLVSAAQATPGPRAES